MVDARLSWWRGLRCYGGRTVAMVTARARALTMAYVGWFGRPGRARRRSYLQRCIAREGERKEGVVASRTFCPGSRVETRTALNAGEFVDPFLSADLMVTHWRGAELERSMK